MTVTVVADSQLVLYKSNQNSDIK